jgi:hypothetical protein
MQRNAPNCTLLGKYSSNQRYRLAVSKGAAAGFFFISTVFAGVTAATGLACFQSALVNFQFFEFTNEGRPCQPKASLRLGMAIPAD